MNPVTISRVNSDTDVYKGLNSLFLTMILMWNIYWLYWWLISVREANWPLLMEFSLLTMFFFSIHKARIWENFWPQFHSDRRNIGTRASLCPCLQRKNDKVAKVGIITSHAINTQLIDVVASWWGLYFFTLPIYISFFPRKHSTITLNHDFPFRFQHVGPSIEHLQFF